MAQEFTAKNVARITNELMFSQLPSRLMENYLANAEERGRIEVKKLGLIAKQKITDAIPLVILGGLFEELEKAESSLSFYKSKINIPMKTRPSDNIVGTPFAIGIKDNKYGSPSVTGFMPDFSIEKASNSIYSRMSNMNASFSKEVTQLASNEIIRELAPFERENTRIAMERIRKPELRANKRPVTAPIVKTVGPFVYNLEVPPKGEVAKVKNYFARELESMYSFMQNIVIISQMWSGMPWRVRERLFTKSVTLLSDISFNNIVNAIFSRATVFVSLMTTVRADPSGYLSIDYHLSLDLYEIENMIKNQSGLAVRSGLYRATQNVISQQRGEYREFFGLLEEYIRYPNTGFRRK